MDYNRVSAEIIHGFIKNLRIHASIPSVDYVRISAEIFHGFMEVLRIVAKTPKYSSSGLCADIRRYKSGHGFIESLRIVAKTPVMDCVQISAEIIHRFIEVLCTIAKILWWIMCESSRKNSSDGLCADIRRNNL